MLLTFPEAERLVGPWRSQGDPAAALGVPAHVTLLYPFLPPDRLDVGVVAELEWFFRGVDAFDVRFERVEEFADDGVVYLDPDGKELDELATALARRWPETPPYGGRVHSPHAHLTVAHTSDAMLRSAATAAVLPGLPLETQVERAGLWTCSESGSWEQVEQFAFAAADPQA